MHLMRLARRSDSSRWAAGRCAPSSRHCWNGNASPSCPATAPVYCAPRTRHRDPRGMKLAGGDRLDKLDSQAFLSQAREYERTGDMRDGVLKLLNLELQTHPFSVLRAAALTKWVDAGGYGAIMAGDYPDAQRTGHHPIRRRRRRGGRPIQGRLRPVRRPTDQGHPGRPRRHRHRGGTGGDQRCRCDGTQDHRVAARRGRRVDERELLARPTR